MNECCKSIVEPLCFELKQTNIATKKQFIYIHISATSFQKTTTTKT